MKSFYETISEYPAVKEKMCSCGIGMDRSGAPDITAKLFSYDTFRKSHQSDFETIELSLELKKEVATAPKVKRPFLIGLLPCGLRNAFKETLFSAFPQYADIENEEVLIEGNLNFEKIIYQYIDSLTSAEELPDIFITADFNSFYHHYFLDYFLTDTYFEALPHPKNSFYKNAGCTHPQGLLRLITANLLVMVVDTTQYPEGNWPKSLAQLTAPELKKSVVLRGDADFFCNAAFFPIYQRYGEQGLMQLAQNTITGMHPSEMVKTMNSGNSIGASVYVMPYSFALKIKNNERFKTIYPDEGAIVSPVQILVRKGAYHKHKAVIDFILGEEMGNVLEKLGFPTNVASIEKETEPSKLAWPGWDYIYNTDMRQTKEKMQELFYSKYTKAQ